MDKEEFKRIYMPHYKTLYRVAFSLVRNEQDAEDMLQNLYLKLWTKRDSLPADSRKLSYLVTVMRHSYYDRLKLQRPDMSAQPSDILTLPSSENVSTQIEAVDEADQVVRLINRLPEKERRVIRLHAVEGHSYDEMEQETGLSQSNLRVIVMRTKNKLKEQFVKLTESWNN